MKTLLASLAVSAVAIFGAHADPSSQRVLSIGGAVTEIVYALGEDGRLIGRDSTSTYPAAARELPDVGYMRALAPEGVLSIEPDLILAHEGSGPTEAIDVLKSASVDYVEVPGGFSAAGIDEAIRVVAEALGVDAKGDAMRADIAAQMDALAESVGTIAEKKRVLFILSMQDGRVLASGTGTAADGILALAGAQNAILDFQGYKQLTDEAIITANPDAILMMDRGGGHAADSATVLGHPALAATQAAKDGALIRMDGSYLLGFGPRTADAALDLAKALYGNDLR
ncbi:ABC transporter substrate-binding protein [Oricola sp.]|uniref:heme/hemin ABC transporter substrate-binding protein n=1 Tax=Oricola sp. TaxID=1979950 RepID=UPI0025F03F9B|nr:ABC transporter substrate-binding protein [Oricola sp.]MCI5076944.1 ABC transporter substrate-binding protein [Oricola sp.]